MVSVQTVILIMIVATLIMAAKTYGEGGTAGANPGCLVAGKRRSVTAF
jgi:hypothetical protein